MNEAQRDVALFRYSLIREAADESLSTRQRGQLVRQLASREHLGPKDRRIRVRRGTIDRWIRAYRSGGFEALAPESRAGEPVTEKRLLDLAEALKREVPRRTAAQVAQIIRTSEGAGPSERTLQRHFARLGLNTRPDGSAPAAFGRFEAAAPGDLWTGDALHGPTIAGRKSYLFCFIDDHSRALVGYRWGLSEDTVRLEAALRNALGVAWRAQGGLPRQRIGHGVAPTTAGLCQPRGAPGAFPTGKATRPREDRTDLRDGPPPVPRRGRGPPSRRPSRTQPALQRLGRDRLSPPGPFRDRPGADRAAVGRGCTGAPHSGRDSARPSCGQRPARSPRQRRSRCTEIPSRSMPPWSGRASKSSSTLSTSRASRSASRAAPWEAESRSPSDATRTPRPARKRPRHPHRPASTTSACWPSAARRSWPSPSTTPS